MTARMAGDPNVGYSAINLIALQHFAILNVEF